ncbi:uncharacterized protein HMPREF1541_09667 [Cyphellophora europaea CBS 101466]|uniref:D-isomer specific 2-hydroxyacid dehydrogenase NAD-binding domain-containing protein n=1 Tax=Cyphellophora europaea (strain CBS 101466) TaxID=1220924 RepID=W2S7Z0_CYPE1|nr:uncharacterized protein HMPREF1541_09667 [Cyphellophora europaea CBS 101466]ETN44792.1 hypothetical protein HMPREF1541_09667 [Cyphellophora europaea CBS 101466]
MVQKPDVLLIDSTVQAVDVERRQALSEKFNLIYYDCNSTAEFIERLHGPWSNIVAISRNGWLKAGPLAEQRPFASDVVPHFPTSLKIICCSGHGHDAADVQAITAKGIWYCNTPDSCTEAVANTALSLVLDSFRYLTYAQWCARYDWLASRDLGMKAVDPCGKTLGIVGLGDIGIAIARKCEAALSMHIHYQGPRRKQVPWTYHANLEEMIMAVDCILIAAPYTKETHHLLDQRRLSLKPGLRVVNIARGKMIDEEALLAALDDGRVAGAGLDVHENEPGINPKLKENWRVAVLPHIGVCSMTSWENFEKTNLDNLMAYFATGKPLTPVNNIE